MDKELKNIALSLYCHEIEGNIPDLIGDCENDSDNNDALCDYAGQHIFDDGSKMTADEISEVAQAVADYYFPKED